MTTVLDATTPISAFLDAAAAKQPTPGGGSAAALTGALAASMGEMVLNYSVNKKDLAAFRPELEIALGEFHRARLIMLELMVEDQAAFLALSAAKKNDDQAAIPAALLASIRIPQTIGATAVAMLEIAHRIAEKVNRYLISDLAVCGDLAMATAQSAAYNVRANLPDVTDTEEKAKLSDGVDRMLAHGVELVQRLSKKIA